MTDDDSQDEAGKVGPPASDRGVYGISVASELSGISEQSLRLYERHGLLTPARSAGGTRRYSAEDLVRLQRISELVAAGVNLAGIDRILSLEDRNTLLDERNVTLEGDNDALRGDELAQESGKATAGEVAPARRPRQARPVSAVRGRLRNPPPELLVTRKFRRVVSLGGYRGDQYEKARISCRRSRCRRRGLCPRCCRVFVVGRGGARSGQQLTG